MSDERKTQVLVDGVRRTFQISGSELVVLDRIDLDIKEGEFISIVGASGCGKSTLLKLIVGLDHPTSGQIKVGERVVTEPSLDCGIIFQEARLYPWLTVWKNVEFGITRKLGAAERRELIQQHIDLVVLHGFENALPKQLSGGMQQRVSIARAIMLQPALLVLDEPTSALDVSVQAQTLNELLKLQGDYNMTYLFITHNLSVVRYMSDRICVMYGGQIMEIGSTEQVYAHYRHPYTFGLMSSVPPLHPKFRNRKKNLLSGEMPSLVGDGKGCAFASRCKFCKEICKEQRPEMKTVGDDHFAACHFAGELTF